MTGPDPGVSAGPEAAEELARRLEEHARGLSPADEALLRALLYRAMDPVDRARERASPGLFSPEEERLLGEINGTPGSR